MSEQKDTPQFDEELLAQILEQLIPETREIIDHLNLCLIQLDQNPKDEALTETIKRGFHTMKGSAGFAGLDQLSLIAKAFEFLMADAMKGNVLLTAAAVNLMYEGLDAIAEIIDLAESGNMSQIDASPLIGKVELFKTGKLEESVFEDDIYALEKGTDNVGEKIEEVHKAPNAPCETSDLLKVYQEGYRQLAALKHVVFSSIHLDDSETMAAGISRQIQAHLEPAHNSIWFISGSDTFVEIARDGAQLDTQSRREIPSNLSEDFQLVLVDQLMVWPSDIGLLQGVLSEYRAPVIFPIKTNIAVLGLLIVDPGENSELEVYQFITQFSAMIINLSDLHRKVDEQREALDEMAGVLYKQNAQLSIVNQLGLELVRQEDPGTQCRITVDTLVDKLNVNQAAIFLYHGERREFSCEAYAGGSGELVGHTFCHGQNEVLDRIVQADSNKRIHDTPAKPVDFGIVRMAHWMAQGIKGREKLHGTIVIDMGDEELDDALSIIINYLAVLFEKS